MTEQKQLLYASHGKDGYTRISHNPEAVPGTQKPWINYKVILNPEHLSKLTENLQHLKKRLKKQ